MTWLQGGPYYELSFLVRTPDRKEVFLSEFLEKLTHSGWSFRLNAGKDEVENMIHVFENGVLDNGVNLHFFNPDISLDIAGTRKSRLFVAVISNELAMVNFWFYGSIWDAPEWDQPGIKPNDKDVFKRFFEHIFEILKPIAGTMGYEVDCSDLFDTQVTYPDDFYAVESLSPEGIKKRIDQTINAFEYCRINAQYFRLRTDLVFEGKIEYPT